jgi:type IV secretion system protein VirD4
VIMGPRSNKTSAIAVPAVLSAPGLVLATSNKADLWALTSGMRAAAGPVWTFDPQEIAHAPQRWWWDPLRAVREAPEAHRNEAAIRLSAHFMGTIGGTRRDPFFHAAGEQVLVGTLLAAAVSNATLRDVVAWLQYGRRDAIAALDQAGADEEAADLEASLGGADVTTKGIFQTARTATRSLSSKRILRWITPPATWRTPPCPPESLPELDPWRLVADASTGAVTVHLLSKEGAGTAAPVVAALVDRVLEVAELSAQARGGRLDPPVVAVLDEAANICPIQTLPQLYSHFGSRGIQMITMLQSYQQGVGVWGAQGMDALWSAATVKLVGAGVDDHDFLRRLSGLIGDYEVEKISVSHERGRGASRQYSMHREPVLPVSALRALPRSQAVLLATGRSAGLGELRPWYREPHAGDLETYSATALGELRAAAREALGPLNPVAAAIDATEGDK